jgi:hypothetical protein
MAQDFFTCKNYGTLQKSTNIAARLPVQKFARHFVIPLPKICAMIQSTWIAADSSRTCF